MVSAGKRRLAQASSCSLANATFEPQNEIEPMIAANTIGISDSSGMSPTSRNSTSEISATAPPPTPLNSATICGIAVIFTLRAARDADRRADRDADHDQRPVADPLVEQRATQRDRHADRGDLVAPHRRARAAHHAQADDEQREADDVEEVDDVGAAHSPSVRSAFGIRLACP